MDMSGTGISGAIKVDIQTNFESSVIYALKWIKLSSGKWTATDRGASSDVYRARISIIGRESYINSIIQAVYDNRIAGSNELTLSNFSSTEKIFGEDVDHSSITATVVDMSNRRQISFLVFSVDLTLQAISPSFLGSASGSINFDGIDYSYDAYSTNTITKYDTYTGVFSYIDSRSDTGVFSGIGYLTNSNMQTFRRNLATYRDAAISTTLNGVDHVFGSIRSNYQDWPKNLIYIDVVDKGYWGLHYHLVQFQAVEDI
jgi:hypothetical protein